MLQSSLNVRQIATLLRFWQLAITALVSMFALVVAAGPVLASDACNYVNNQWGGWKDTVPNLTIDLYPVQVHPPGFEAGEAIRYQFVTSGSSARELNPANNMGGGADIYDDGTEDTIYFRPNGTELNVSGTLQLLPNTDYQFFVLGGQNSGGFTATGSVSSRLICYGATTSVSTILPTRGPMAGGNNVVITGTGMAAVDTVSFDGIATTDFTLDNAGQITVRPPPHAAGEVDVTVARSGGPQLSAGRYTYVPVPTVTLVSPGFALTSGAVDVTISGTNFLGTTAVSFGTAAATNLRNITDSQVIVTAPAGTAGEVDVTVTAEGGVSASGPTAKFTYVGAPSIASINPVAGPSGGGNTIFINGQDFVQVSGVRFGLSAPVTPSTYTATQMAVVAPAGSAGQVAVEITAFGGLSNSATYTYYDPPTVSAILPDSGPVGGRPGVVINGANLKDATVTFDGISAAVAGTSASQITVTAPPHAAGAVAVVVTTPGGSVSAGSFLYRDLPVISGVSPAAGPLGGNNSVTINGSGFAGATAVTFGGNAAAINANSDTQIVVTVPPGTAAAAVDVVVTTPGGMSTTGSGMYTYRAVPTVSSLSPPSGPLAGGTIVTITGTGFTADATVQFGSAAGTNVAFIDANTISAHSPPGSAGAVGVSVTTVGGTSGAATQFTYLAAPVTGGSTLTVAANSAATVVPLVITGSDVTQVTVLTPAQHGTAVASGTSISYQPAAGYSGTDSFSYTATNAGGISSPATVAITVTPPVLVLSPASGALPNGQTGVGYNQSFTAADGTPDYTFAVTAGALPAGLSLSEAGVLGGMPTSVAATTFVVTATDANGATGTGSYSLAITQQPPIANAVTTVVPVNSVNNSITPLISGGAATSVAVSSPALNGSVSASGTTLSYTPNTGFSGTDSFSYTATNTGGTSAPATVTVTVVNPSLTLLPADGALPPTMVGAVYSQAITTTGGSGTYTYGLAAGALPTGLNLSASGVISGTPTTVASASFTIISTDTTSAFGLASYTLTVNPAVPVASDVSLTVAANAGATSVPPALSGGAATTVAIASVPSHGTASVSGITMSYTPDAGYSGTDTFTYTATNISGTSAPATVAITVTAPTLLLSPAAGALPSGMVGASFNQTVVASGGTAPYTYSVSTGSLPAGISLDQSSGALTGMPTAAGGSSFTIEATDTYGAVGSSAYTLDVAVQPPVANPVSAIVGRDSINNLIALSLTGGPASSVAVTAVPSNGTATVSGTSITYTPTTGYAGSDSFSYTASNASGTSAPATVSIVVVNPTLVLAPAAGPLPDGTVGTGYAQMLSASGGTAPYSFAVTAGSLPTGLAIAPGASLIAGTPATAGIYNFSITATDAGGATGVAAYSLRIFPAALVLSPPSGSGLPPATTGTAYSYTGISVSGGSGPATFTATGLPAGLAMAAGGSISGIPTAAGTYPVTVTATDTAGAVALAVYPLTVNAGAGDFIFSPAAGALPQAMVGEAYSQDISASGGAAPLIYSLAGGTLPAGLVLNVSNGDLNGPLAADVAPGTYSFTIAVRDAAGVTGSASFTLQVVPRAVTVADKEVTVQPGGAPPNVYLNAGATGGPFVNAVLGTVSPPSAGTAEIIRGELAQVGPAAPTGFYLRFTPNPAFSGRVIVGYQLISAFGTSNVGTVAYNLNFNAVAVAEDIDDLVHDFVRTRQNLLSSTIRVPGLLERRRMQNSRDAVTLRMSPQEEGMRAAFSTSLVQIEAARDRADGLDASEPRPFNIWIDGAIRVHGGGDDNEDDDRWGSFALLSVGMDYLLSDRALIGISAHFDRMTDPTDEDTELTGNGWFAGPYVSLEIARGVFFDSSLLYGGSWNDIDTPFFDGKFDTTRWMWDGSLKGEWYLDETTVITPKLRAVYLTETVKDYAVSNDAGDRLLLEGFSMEQLRASIGAEIERRIVLSNGMVLTPRLGATVGFAGLDGEGTFANITAGAALETETAWMFDFALLFDIEGEGDVSVGARARASTRF